MATISGTLELTAAQGIELAYDGASNRRTATSYQSGTSVTESYTYDENNRLTSTNRGGSLTSSRTYDWANRVTDTVSYSSPGTVSEHRTYAYNAKGWLTQLDVYNASATHKQRNVYTGGGNGYDALGNVLQYQIIQYQGASYTSTYAYSYLKYDGYKESVVAGTSTYFSPGSTTTTYDANGNAVNVTETFQASKNRSFLTTNSGEILQKTEGSATQFYFFENDKAIGSSGALSAADFDYNYTPVSDLYPALTPNSYVVSAGDTLRSIAFAAYGDAQLWYQFQRASKATSWVNWLSMDV